MCLAIGPMIVAQMLMGGMLNGRAIIAAVILTLVIGLLTWLARRFFPTRVTFGLGALLVLAFVGLAVVIEWQCQSTMRLPLPSEGDNDGTIRVLMMAGGVLALFALATVCGVLLGWLVPVRRKLESLT